MSIPISHSIVENSKKSVVYIPAVSADGKVRNYMDNLIHYDQKNIEENFEFYVPKHSDFKLTNSDLSNLKIKINELGDKYNLGNNGTDAFNDMMLTSGNPFRLILIWLLQHVFPKMTEVADRNMQLYGIGLAKALQTLVERSETSLKSLAFVCEEDKKVASLHMWSSGVDLLGAVTQGVSTGWNEVKNGSYKLGKLNLDKNDALYQNIKTDHESCSKKIEDFKQSGLIENMNQDNIDRIDDLKTQLEKLGMKQDNIDKIDNLKTQLENLGGKVGNNAKSVLDLQCNLKDENKSISQKKDLEYLELTNNIHSHVLRKAQEMKYLPSKPEDMPIIEPRHDKLQEIDKYFGFEKEAVKPLSIEFMKDASPKSTSGIFEKGELIGIVSDKYLLDYKPSSRLISLIDRANGTPKVIGTIDIEKQKVFQTKYNEFFTNRKYIYENQKNFAPFLKSYNANGQLNQAKEISRELYDKMAYRQAVTEQLLNHYQYTLGEKKAHQAHSTNLKLHFAQMEINYAMNRAWMPSIGPVGQTIGAVFKTGADKSSADNRFMSESNRIFMELYNQEMQTKTGQMDSLKNVAREACDLVAKFLENYFNTANASNLQR